METPASRATSFNFTILRTPGRRAAIPEPRLLPLALNAEPVLVEQKDVLRLGREANRFAGPNPGQPALLERDLRAALGLQVDVGDAAQLLDHLHQPADAFPVPAPQMFGAETHRHLRPGGESRTADGGFDRMLRKRFGDHGRPLPSDGRDASRDE